MSDPERILIVRLSHLGDVVSALGVFHALHAAYPRARIGWAVQSEFAGLLRGLAGLERIFAFERTGGIGEWLRLVREIRGFAPDLAVDAQGNLKSASVTLCSGAGRRVGSARADWREKLGALAVNEQARECLDEERHAMDRVLAIVHRLVGDAGGEPRFDAGLSALEIARGEELRDEFRPRGARAIALHLSSQEDVRAWPVARWEALVRELRGAGYGCLVLSGPREERAGRELVERIGRGEDVRHWVGQTDLRELAAFFTAAGAEGWRLVACDSGPMHLAWASGLPVVVLEGPQDALRTGPWPARASEPHRVVRSRTPPPCAPCLERSCTWREGPTCMSSIEPADVVAALRSPG